MDRYTVTRSVKRDIKKKKQKKKTRWVNRILATMELLTWNRKSI